MKQTFVPNDCVPSPHDSSKDLEINTLARYLAIQHKYVCDKGLNVDSPV